MPTVKCDFCQTLLDRSANRIAKCRHFFCNPQCKGQWQRDRYVVDDAALVNPYRVAKINGKSVGRHRLIVEAAIGRKLDHIEHVHHANEDKKDNSIGNLEVLHRSAHASLHNAHVADAGTVKSLREDGLSLDGIAQSIGVSRKCVTRTLKKQGIDPSARIWSWSLDEAVSLLEKGMNKPAVALALGIPIPTLRKGLLSRGIKSSDSRMKVFYDWALIDELRAAGKGVRVISRQIGCSYGGLRKALIKTGRLCP